MVVITPGTRKRPQGSMENTLMMVLDYVGDGEAMVYAQLGQHPLVRTTETSPERR